jgi:uncharacterized Zn finger protein
VSPRDRSWWGDPDSEDNRLPAARGKGSRRGFGATWWGKAWVEALEHRAALDRNRLPRGRSYARRGTVEEFVIEPGQVSAQVQGSRAKPYRVTVRVPTFDAGQWDRVLDAIAAQLGRAAALLDGELPPELVSDVASAGLDLLPGAGEVQPRCSCPDWADPCKHSAAVCYLVADALDADPFSLLLLRGRSQEALFAALRARRGGSGGPGASTEDGVAGTGSDAVGAVDVGVDARSAYARPLADLPPVPAPPLPASHPGRPAVLSLDPPSAAGVSRDALVALAQDAAARAWSLASGAGSALPVSAEVDLARRAAGLLGRSEFAALARRAGLTGTALTRLAIAWREASSGGVVVLSETWTPPREAIEEVRAALRDAPGLEGPVRVSGNRVTRGRVQLRLGRDDLWYRLHRSGHGWDLDGPPSADPSALLRP